MVLGDLEKEHGDWRAAEGLYRRAVVSDPSSAFAHFSLAAALDALSRPHEALASFRAANDLLSTAIADNERDAYDSKPSRPASLASSSWPAPGAACLPGSMCRARLFLPLTCRGSTPVARRPALRAVQAEACLQMGQLLLESSVSQGGSGQRRQQQRLEAIVLLNRSLELRPSSARALALVGEALQRENQPQPAAASFSRLLAMIGDASSEGQHGRNAQHPPPPSFSCFGRS